MADKTNIELNLAITSNVGAIKQVEGAVNSLEGTISKLSKVQGLDPKKVFGQLYSTGFVSDMAKNINSAMDKAMQQMGVKNASVRKAAISRFGWSAEDVANSLGMLTKDKMRQVINDEKNLQKEHLNSIKEHQNKVKQATSQFEQSSAGYWNAANKAKNARRKDATSAFSGPVAAPEDVMGGKKVYNDMVGWKKEFAKQKQINEEYERDVLKSSYKFEQMIKEAGVRKAAAITAAYDKQKKAEDKSVAQRIKDQFDYSKMLNEAYGMNATYDRKQDLRASKRIAANLVRDLKGIEKDNAVQAQRRKISDLLNGVDMEFAPRSDLKDIMRKSAEKTMKIRNEAFEKASKAKGKFNDYMATAPYLQRMFTTEGPDGPSGPGGPGGTIDKFFNSPIFGGGNSTESMKKIKAVAVDTFDSISGRIRNIAGALGNEFTNIIGMWKTGFLTLAGAATAAAGALLYVGYQLKGMTEDVILSTEKMRGYNIAMLGIMKSQTAVDTLMEKSFKVAERFPLSYQQVFEATKAFSVIGPIQTMLKDSTKVNQTLERAFQIIMSLSTIEPEWGLQGAIFTLRETLAGDFLSLKRRYELPVNLMFTVDGKPMSSVKNDPGKLLESLAFNLEQIMPKSSLELTAKQFGMVMKKIEDQWFKFKVKIGNSGMYDAIVGDLTRAFKYIEIFVDDSFSDNLATRLSDSFYNAWNAAINITRGVVKQFGVIIGRDFTVGENITKSIGDAFEGVTKIFVKLGNVLKSDDLSSWIKGVKAYIMELYEYVKVIALEIFGEFVSFTQKSIVVIDKTIEIIGSSIKGIKKAAGLSDSDLAQGAIAVWLFGPGNALTILTNSFGIVKDLGVGTFKAMGVGVEGLVKSLTGINNPFERMLSSLTAALGVIAAAYTISKMIDNNFNKDERDKVASFQAQSGFSATELVGGMKALTPEHQKDMQAARLDYISKDAEIKKFEDALKQKRQISDALVSMDDLKKLEQMKTDLNKNIFSQFEEVISIVQKGDTSNVVTMLIESSMKQVAKSTGDLIVLSGKTAANKVKETFTGVPVATDIKSSRDFLESRRNSQFVSRNKLYDIKAQTAVGGAQFLQMFEDFTGHRGSVTAGVKAGKHSTGAKIDFDVGTTDKKWILDEAKLKEFAQKAMKTGATHVMVETNKSGGMFKADEQDKLIKAVSNINSELGGNILEFLKSSDTDSMGHLDVRFNGAIKAVEQKVNGPTGTVAQLVGTAATLKDIYDKQKSELDKIPINHDEQAKTKINDLKNEAFQTSLQFRQTMSSMGTIMNEIMPNEVENALSKFRGESGQSAFRVGNELTQSAESAFASFVQQSEDNITKMKAERKRIGDFVIDSSRVALDTAINPETIKQLDDAIIKAETKFAKDKLDNEKKKKDFIARGEAFSENFYKRNLISEETLKTMEINPTQFRGGASKELGLQISKAAAEMVYVATKDSDVAAEASKAFVELGRSIGYENQSFEDSEKILTKYFDNMNEQIMKSYKLVKEYVPEIAGSFAEGSAGLLPSSLDFLFGKGMSSSVNNGLAAAMSTLAKGMKDANLEESIDKNNKRVQQIKELTLQVNKSNDAVFKANSLWKVYNLEQSGFIDKINNINPKRIDDFNALLGQTGSMNRSTRSSLFSKAGEMTEYGMFSGTEALSLGMMSSASNFKNWSEQMFEIGSNLVTDLNSMFESNFFDVFTGKLNNLGDIFSSLGNSIRDMLAKVISKLLAMSAMKIILGVEMNASGGMSMSGGGLLSGLMSSFTGGGNSGGLFSQIIGSAAGANPITSQAGAAGMLLSGSGIPSGALTGMLGAGAAKLGTGKLLGAGGSLSKLWGSAKGFMAANPWVLPVAAAGAFLTQPGRLFGGTVDHTGDALAGFNASTAGRNEYLGRRASDAQKYYGAMSVGDITKYQFGTAPVYWETKSGNGITSKKTKTGHYDDSAFTTSVPQYYKLLNQSMHEHYIKMREIDKLRETNEMGALKEEMALKENLYVMINNEYVTAMDKQDWKRVDELRDAVGQALDDIQKTSKLIADEIIATNDTIAAYKLMLNGSDSIAMKNEEVRKATFELLNMELAGTTQSKEWFQKKMEIYALEKEATDMLIDKAKLQKDQAAKAMDFYGMTGLSEKDRGRLSTYYRGTANDMFKSSIFPNLGINEADAIGSDVLEKAKSPYASAADKAAYKQAVLDAIMAFGNVQSTLGQAKQNMSTLYRGGAYDDLFMGIGNARSVAATADKNDLIYGGAQTYADTQVQLSDYYKTLATDVQTWIDQGYLTNSVKDLLKYSEMPLNELKTAFEQIALGVRTSSFKNSIMGTVKGFESAADFNNIYNQIVGSMGYSATNSGMEGIGYKQTSMGNMKATMGGQALSDLYGSINSSEDPFAAWYDWSEKNIKTRIQNAQEGSDEYFTAFNDLFSLLAEKADRLKEKADSSTQKMEDMLTSIDETMKSRIAEESKTSKGDIFFMDVRKYGDVSSDIAAIQKALKNNDPNAAALIRTLKDKIGGMR